MATATPTDSAPGSESIRSHASFIWSVADLLRGDYKQSEYGKVILPLTVIRRLDCVFVGRSKTDAGMREVDMLPVLRDELLAYKASAKRTGLDDYVFTTSAGGKRDKDNLARRVMGPIVTRADKLLAEREEHPLPVGVTAHKLRHTFASMLIALGKDPAYVMGQLGHADPKFTLRVYTHMMRRGDDERQALLDLVEGRGFRHQKAPVPKPADPPRNPTDPVQKNSPG